MASYGSLVLIWLCSGYVYGNFNPFAYNGPYRPDAQFAPRFSAGSGDTNYNNYNGASNNAPQSGDSLAPLGLGGLSGFYSALSSELVNAGSTFADGSGATTTAVSATPEPIPVGPEALTPADVPEAKKASVKGPSTNSNNNFNHNSFGFGNGNGPENAAMPNFGNFNPNFGNGPNFGNAPNFGNGPAFGGPNPNNNFAGGPPFANGPFNNNNNNNGGFGGPPVQVDNTNGGEPAVAPTAPLNLGDTSVLKRYGLEQLGSFFGSMVNELNHAGGSNGHLGGSVVSGALVLTSTTPATTKPAKIATRNDH
jgi:hypothetical protein